MAAPVYPPDDAPLQTDWLRLKSHIYDPATGLPTLAAVLEDVRRLLERRAPLALVYLDLGGGLRLEAQHGWHAYDATVQRAADALRQAPAGTTDIVAVMGARADKFVLFAGGSDTETIDLPAAEARGARLADAVTRALLGAEHGRGTPVLAGVALVHRDPMLRAERAVHRALDEAMFRSLRRRSADEDAQARWLDGVIAAGSLISAFQPIVDLRSLEIVGQEAFTRGPAGGLIEDAEALFALAARTGRASVFEAVCRRATLSVFRVARASAASVLFLKTTSALDDPTFASDGLAREVEELGLRTADVVVEVQERLAALDKQALRGAVRHLKSRGFRLAIDDMGAGYSSLQSVAEMEPDYLKFDMSLVRHLDRSPIKRSLLETVVRVSSSVGAPVIAEGIENAAELVAIREMGVPLGQGRLLSPEAVPNEVVPA
jgi:EAL domain-containing protein (putative c-di-GMP-specific phosphodiesterase class I)